MEAPRAAHLGAAPLADRCRCRSRCVCACHCSGLDRFNTGYDIGHIVLESGCVCVCVCDAGFMPGTNRRNGNPFTHSDRFQRL